MPGGASAADVRAAAGRPSLPGAGWRGPTRSAGRAAARPCSVSPDMPDDASPRYPARRPGTHQQRTPPSGANSDPRGADPLKPAVTPAERERGRIVGLAALGGAAVIAVVVTVGIFV